VVPLNDAVCGGLADGVWEVVVLLLLSVGLDSRGNSRVEALLQKSQY
jgi:hypothetical protein